MFHILGIIIPTDFHVFQRGRHTTNQIIITVIIIMIIIIMIIIMISLPKLH